MEEQTAPRDARISYTLAIVCIVAGAAMIGSAAYAMTPGACGHADGCLGGRDATPLTGIAVGAGLVGAGIAAGMKARALRAQNP